MWKPVLTAAALVSTSGLATAQTSIFDIPESERDTFLDIGGALLTRPAYLGSNEQDTNILPYIAGEYEGRFFIDPARGAGVHAINRSNLQISGFAGFATGRDAEDTGVFDDLIESGSLSTPADIEAADDALDLDASVLASASARYRFAYGLVELSGSVPVTGDVDGYRAELSLASKIPYEPIGIAVYPGVRATYTSSAWNDSYYGIDAEQSAATGLAEFDTDSDVSVLGVFALVTWDALSQSMGDDIQIVGVVNYNWLQGDLQDSLLTPDDQGLTAALGIAKRF